MRTGLLLLLSTLVFCACWKAEKVSMTTPEEHLSLRAVCRDEIQHVSLSPGGRPTSFYSELSRLCNLIKLVTNGVERTELLSELTHVVANLRPSEASPLVKEGLANEFWRVLEYLSYQLVENGFEYGYVADFIFAGFKEYHRMCFSLGDENDNADGMGLPARERRRRARGLRLAWNNAVVFWERTSIRTIFHSVGEDVQARFVLEWREFLSSLKR